jgi:ankyrin repeat protein
MLLDAGAKINNYFPQKVFYSSVQFAAQTGRIEILQLLLQKGGDPNTTSPWAQLVEDDPIGTALQLAVGGNHIQAAEMILKYGATVDAVTPKNPHTALQIAALEGSKQLVEVLLAAGADVNAPPARQRGATALQFAVIGGYLGIAHLLVEKGADVNAPAAEEDGRTALEGAGEHGRIDMVQFLKNAGADLSVGCNQLERACALAWKNGHIATRRLLRDYFTMGA